MQFEVIRKSHKKEILIGVIVFILIAIVFIVHQSFAKYKTVKNMTIVSGTVNYTMSDFQVVAIKTSEDGSVYQDANEIPKSGYNLNSEKSVCKITGETVDRNITINYHNGVIGFDNITQKSTKCYLYFDKIKDTTPPVISNVTTSATKTGITVNVSASDDKGVTEYWYQINNNTPIKGTTNSYTFTGLTASTSYTIKVYVKDAAGNQSETITKNVTTEANTVTLTAKSGSGSGSSFTYTYNGASGTIKSNETWVLPIGSIITVSGNQILRIYNSSSTLLKEVRSGTYTITGNEAIYYSTWSCFTEETELLAYDEKKKKKLKRKVKDFKVGDKLYTFDEKSNKFIKTSVKKIEKVKTRDIYAVYLETGDVIRCSEGHAFYVAGVGYMQARELKSNLKLLGMDRNYKIVKIEQEHYENEITLYNLYLDNNNCFVTSAKILSYMLTASTVLTYPKITKVTASGA